MTGETFSRGSKQGAAPATAPIPKPEGSFTAGMRFLTRSAAKFDLKVWSKWWLGAAVLGWLGAFPAAADDDVVVVSVEDTVAGVSLLAIPHQDLLSNDAGALTIQSHTPAARGSVTSSGGEFLYDPGAEFLEVGFDSFSYQTLSTGTESHTVFLVRGLDEFLEIDGSTTMIDGQCALAPGWAFLGNGNSGSGAVVVPTNSGGCALELDLSMAGQNPRIEAPDSTRAGPGGGHTVMILDPGGGGPFDPILDPLDNLIASASVTGSSGEAIPVLAIRLEDSGLVALARQDDGTYAETAAAPLVPMKDTEVALTWWFEGESGLNAGGLLLELDGQLLGIQPEIWNGSFLSEQLSWTFGLHDFSENTGLGLIRIRNEKVWTSSDIARFPPLFSDHGFGAGLGAWSQVVNSSLVSVVEAIGSSDPEWHLTIPIGTNEVGLVDQSVLGLERYTARFELGLEELSMPNWSILTFFEASSTPGTQSPFRLQLLHQSGGVYRVRGRVASGVVGLATPWVTLPASESRPFIELKWRGAESSSTKNGAFSLDVHGLQQSLTGLDNEGLSLEKVQLGPQGVPFGASGDLIVDAFDSWR